MFLEEFDMEGATLFAFLEAACRAIDRLPNVLERKGAGSPRFHYRSRIVAVLIKAWIKRSYRDTETYLYDNKDNASPIQPSSPRPQRNLENHDVAS
jgi:hypothetical protein